MVFSPLQISVTILNAFLHLSIYDIYNFPNWFISNIFTKVSLFDVILQNNLHVTVSSLVASAVVWMPGLPSKLNPVILPLMAAIKREQVKHLAFLVLILIFSALPCKLK